tara:strand:- start:5095 stop:5367 length:273 start_codon:yes stop_codon:yes gene_type:complete
MATLEDQNSPGTEGYLQQTQGSRPTPEGMQGPPQKMMLRKKGGGPQDISPMIGELMAILEAWETKEYATDRERWQSYADDIANLVAQYQG